MKRFIATLSLAMFTAPAALGHGVDRNIPATCTDGQVEVLLLGTYHMSNPGLDSIKLEADDVLSERRQAEIASLVDSLARFEPDKVMIESAYGSDRAQRKYAEWLAGDYTLSRNEIDQVAYRLAAKQGHDAVYPIDYPMFQDSTAYQFYMARNPEVRKKIEQRSNPFAELAEQDQQRLRDSTISEYLKYRNGSDNWFFGLDSRIVLGESIMYADYDQYAGADILSSWYKRNLRIIANLHRSMDAGDERVFILMGSGHNKILWDLIETSPILCRVDARDYL